MKVWTHSTQRDLHQVRAQLSSESNRFKYSSIKQESDLFYAIVATGWVTEVDMNCICSRLEIEKGGSSVNCETHTLTG